MAANWSIRIRKLASKLTKDHPRISFRNILYSNILQSHFRVQKYHRLVHVFNSMDSHITRVGFFELSSRYYQAFSRASSRRQSRWRGPPPPSWPSEGRSSPIWWMSSSECENFPPLKGPDATLIKILPSLRIPRWEWHIAFLLNLKTLNIILHFSVKTLTKICFI